MKNTKSCLIVLISLVFLTPSFKGSLIRAQSDTANYEVHYVLAEFVKGSVKMKDGRTEEAIMDYNKLTEEMIFEKNGRMLALDSLEKIDTVYLESRVFVPHEKIFLELLVKGPVSLFLEHKCNLLAAGNPAGYGGTTETGAATNISILANTGRAYKMHLPRDYHVTDASLFWIRKNGEYSKANTTSQITGAFPDHKKEIKQYIKDHKLDIKKTEDLITLIVKCNDFVH
jgi:hypothetical protein